MNLFAKGKAAPAPSAKAPAFSPIDRVGLLGLLAQIVNTGQSGVLELHEPRGNWVYAFQAGALTHASGGRVRGARQAFDLLWEFQAGEFMFAPGQNAALAGNLYIDKGRLLDLLNRSQAVLQGPSAPYIPPGQQRPIAPVPRPYSPPSPGQMPPAWQPGMQQQAPGWPQVPQPGMPPQGPGWPPAYPTQPAAAQGQQLPAAPGQPYPGVPAQPYPAAPGQPYPGPAPQTFPGAPPAPFQGTAPQQYPSAFPGAPGPTAPPLPPQSYPPVRGNVRPQVPPTSAPPTYPSFPPQQPVMPPQGPSSFVAPQTPAAPARPATPPSFSVPPMPLPKKAQSAPVYQPQPMAQPPMPAPEPPKAGQKDDLAALRASLAAQAPAVKPAPSASWGIRKPDGTVAAAAAPVDAKGKAKGKEKKKKGDSKLVAGVKLQLIKFLLWACERRYSPDDHWTLKDAFEVSTMELRDQFFGAFSQTFTSTKKNRIDEDDLDDMAAGRMRGRGRRH